MKELWLVDSYDGPQQGAHDNPFVARDADDFAWVLRNIEPLAPYRLYATGDFLTWGAYEWGPMAIKGPRLGRSSSIVLDGSLSLDPNVIGDDYIGDEPLHLICSSEGWGYGKPAEEAWASVPTDEALVGGTLIANHSKLVDRWRAKGKSLRPSGVILQGHDAAIVDVKFEDFGCWYPEGSTAREAFPAIIIGAMAGPDRHSLATLDPLTHIFRPARITGCTFDRYDPASSNDQVTVNMILGAMCNTQLRHDPWGEIGEWRQLFRENAVMEDNKVIASGKNVVQGFTIYQSLRGLVTRNRTEDAEIGYYGDFYSTRGVRIIENEFLNPYAGVQLVLSPTGPGFEQYSHEDYEIGPNKITSRGPNVRLLAYNPTERRYIRDIRIDASLTVENLNNAAEFTVINQEREKRGGCRSKLPF